MISVLLGCGLRRAELAALAVEDLQIRQGHWAIVDLVGKGGHIRTVPMPLWVTVNGGEIEQIQFLGHASDVHH
jgi:integrase